MKNKIFIMTFHWATNYGAVLQAYALQKYLEQRGYDVNVVNYVPRKHRKTLFKCFLTRKLWKIKKNILEFRKEKKIEKFRRKYLCMTKCYCCNKQLKKAKWESATYICGSDQIWNPHFTMMGEGKATSAYYLEFAPIRSKKIAYAASFGTKEISEYMGDFIKGLLQSFDKISVRENSAKKIIETLGMEATVVCDPVFLLEKSQYDEFVVEAKNTKKQLFSYILHENQKKAQSIGKYIAKTLSLNWVEECGWSIERWMSNIKKSEFIVTNSFHATAFALIFHVPFVTVLISGSGMNDRIQTLLEKARLQNRIIDKYDEEQINEVINSNINWDNVDYEMWKMKKHSINFLTETCKL